MRLQCKRHMQVVFAAFVMLSVSKLQAQHDSLAVTISQCEKELRMSDWSQWGQWAATTAPIRYTGTGKIGLSQFFSSAGNTLQSPYLYWQGLPIVDIRQGGSDTGLIPADMLTGFESSPIGYRIATRNFDTGPSRSRFRYLTLGGYQDFDVSLGLALRPGLIVSAGGFQQKYEHDYGNSIKGDFQRAETGHLSVKWILKPGLTMQYQLLRNRSRVDSVQTLYAPGLGDTLATPRYRRMRYDHRMSLNWTPGSWQHQLVLGAQSQHESWKDLALNKYYDCQGRDIQLFLKSQRDSMTIPLTVGLEAAHQNFTIAGHDYIAQNFVRPFVGLRKKQNGLSLDTQWGLLNSWHSTESEQSVAGYMDVRMRLYSSLAVGASYHQQAQVAALGSIPDRLTGTAGANFITNGQSTPDKAYAHNRGQRSALTLYWNCGHLQSELSLYTTARSQISLMSQLAQGQYVSSDKMERWHRHTGLDHTLKASLWNSIYVRHSFEYAHADVPMPWRLYPEYSGRAVIGFQHHYFESDMHLNISLTADYWTKYEYLMTSAEGTLISGTQKDGIALSAKVGAQIMKQGWIEFSLHNILDTSYTLLSDLPMQGRTARLGFIWELLD